MCWLLQLFFFTMMNRDFWFNNLGGWGQSINFVEGDFMSGDNDEGENDDDDDDDNDNSEDNHKKRQTQPRQKEHNKFLGKNFFLDFLHICY